jgi:hypothetical protein
VHLSAALVVPEAACAGRLFQFLYFGFLGWYVKDAP